ncbi:MAG: glycosyltransferase family 61 protein [Bdellovibrionales bacterium]|nr:glycosyltransferase family 61 protein [Bdellovibrionales bacterium]
MVIQEVQEFMLHQAEHAFTSKDYERCLEFVKALEIQGYTTSETKLMSGLALFMGASSDRVADGDRANRLEAAWDTLEKALQLDPTLEAAREITNQLKMAAHRCVIDGREVVNALGNCTQFLAVNPSRGVRRALTNLKRDGEEYSFGFSVIHDVVVSGYQGFVMDPESGLTFAESFTSIRVQSLRSKHISWPYSFNTGQIPSFEGPIVHMCGLWSGNFFHWINEQVPKLVFLKEMGYDGFFLCPACAHPFIRHTFEILGFDINKVFIYPAGKGIRLSRCILFDNLNFQGLVENLPILEKVRHEFLSCLKLDPSVSKRSSKTKRGLYIQREGTRSVRNEAQVLEAMEPYGIKVIQAEKLTLGEQIRLAYDSDVLIGPHGSGLSLSLFMPYSSAIVELLPFAWYNTCFEHIQKLLKLRHHVVPSSPLSLYESQVVHPHLAYLKNTLELEFGS